jgi:hypothetical protein
MRRYAGTDGSSTYTDAVDRHRHVHGRTDECGRGAADQHIATRHRDADAAQATDIHGDGSGSERCNQPRSDSARRNRDRRTDTDGSKAASGDAKAYEHI